MGVIGEHTGSNQPNNNGRPPSKEPSHIARKEGGGLGEESAMMAEVESGGQKDNEGCNVNEEGEEESILGNTQVKDAEELLPAEHINHPIVYNMHSNYHVLRKNNESALIDSTIEKLI